MNLLQVIVFIGIKGFNVPKMLNAFVIEDEETAKAFETLKEKYWDILISMFTTLSYDDMIYGYDYNDRELSNDVLNIIEEHLAEEDEESETDQVGECTELIKLLTETAWISNITFDGEKVIVG